MTDDMSGLQGNERHDRLAPLAKQIHEPAFGVTLERLAMDASNCGLVTRTFLSNLHRLCALDFRLSTLSLLTFDF